jgi:hypothetical protein
MYENRLSNYVSAMKEQAMTMILIGEDQSRQATNTSKQHPSHIT